MKAGFRAETGTGYASLGSHRENRLKNRTGFSHTTITCSVNNRQVRKKPICRPL
ncbi:hypothetical protein Hdeb2414_s0006g00218001 [Helianthus debilis subsp. tardiflorus]